jgi:hypothetical protein
MRIMRDVLETFDAFSYQLPVSLSRGPALGRVAASSVPAWIPERLEEALERSGKTIAASSLKAFASAPYRHRVAEFLPVTTWPRSISGDSGDLSRDQFGHDEAGPHAEDMIWEFQDITLRLAQQCPIIISHPYDRITVQVVDFTRSEPQIDPVLVRTVQALGRSTQGLSRAPFRLVDDVIREGLDLILRLASTQRIHRLDEGHLWSQVLSVMVQLSQAETIRLKPETEGTR